MLPRIIWSYWHSGERNAPDTVRRCIGSWRKRNPGWSVRFLDRSNIHEHVDAATLSLLTRSDIAVQKKTNILRINLLSGYGGIWADATCLCVEPLDQWIHEYCQAGFFAFRDPGRDRILSNWFLASHHGCHLIQHFTNKHNEFWRKNRFVNQNKPVARKATKALRRVLNKNAKRRSCWTGLVFTKILRAYPYFVFHYHFERVVNFHSCCRDPWERMPYVSATGPHRLHHIGLSTAMTPEIAARINSSLPFVYKLNWRVSAADHPDSVQAYALDRWDRFPGTGRADVAGRRLSDLHYSVTMEPKRS